MQKDEEAKKDVNFHVQHWNEVKVEERKKCYNYYEIDDNDDEIWRWKKQRK